MRQCATDQRRCGVPTGGVRVVTSHLTCGSRSVGEKQAFRVFWRQRIAVASAKGVASTIRHRTPICSGAHWPLQPHHFSNLDLCPPARPTGTNSQNLRAAGDATTLTANG